MSLSLSFNNLSPNNSFPIPRSIYIPPSSLIDCHLPTHHNCQQSTADTTHTTNYRIHLTEHRQVEQIGTPNVLSKLERMFRWVEVEVIDVGCIRAPWHNYRLSSRWRRAT